MRSKQVFLPWIGLLALCMAACGMVEPTGNAADTGGIVVLGALSAPGDIRCVRLRFAGSREVTVDLVPDGNADTRVAGLPTGQVVLSGSAFAGDCAGDPAWTADSLTLTLVAGTPVPAHLSFHRNGIAIVTADFEGASVFSSGDATSSVDLGFAGFPDFSSAMTIEAWVYLRGQHLPEWTSIFNKWTDGGEDKWLALDGNGLPTFGAWKGDPSDYIRATGTEPLAVGRWHHIAGVFDGREARIYVDGALVGAETDEGLIANDVGRAYIGAHPARPYRGIDGGVAEVRVSSTAVYSAAFTPPAHLSNDAATVGLWRLDQGPVTTVIDLAGHGIDGTVSAGASWVDLPGRP
jgi:hypothetical protein